MAATTPMPLVPHPLSSAHAAPSHRPPDQHPAQTQSILRAFDYSAEVIRNLPDDEAVLVAIKCVCVLAT